MKQLLVGLVAIFLVLGSGCSSTHKQVAWPQAVNCLPDPGELVGTVSNILFHQADYKDELTDLARVHGTDTVICLVDRLVRDWTQPGAAQTPERTVATNRGRNFLDGTGTQVKRTEE